METSTENKAKSRQAHFKKIGVAGRIQKSLKLELKEYPHSDENPEWTCKYATWNFFHKGRNRKIERSIGFAVNSKDNSLGIGMNDSGATSFEVNFDYNSDDTILDIISKRNQPFKKIAMYIFKNVPYKKMWIDGKKFPRT